MRISRTHLLGLGVPLAIALCMCAVAWNAEHRGGTGFGFPLDDAWIHCTIARNVAQGHGWCYTAGELSQPSSGPLWTLLVAAGFAIFGPVVWVPKVLAALCLVGCVWAVWRLARLLADEGTAGVAALLTATCAPLVWHGLSGMETPLAALLVTLTVDAFYRWPAGRKRFMWAVLAAASTATRAEALVLLPILALERAFGGAAPAASHAPATGVRRDAMLGVAVGIACLIPYFALNMTHAGSLFPSTFAAKARETGLLYAAAHFDWREMLVSLTLAPYVWAVFGIAFFARMNVGLFVLAPVGAWVLARTPRRAVAPGLLLVALPLLRGIAAPHQTPPIHHGRYVGAIVPLFLLCAAVGVVALWRARGQRAPAAGAESSPAWLAALATPGVRIACVTVLALATGALVHLQMTLPREGAGILSAMRAVVPGAVSEGGLHPLLQTERLGLALAFLPPVVILALGFGRQRIAAASVAVFAVIAIGVQAASLVRLPSQYARNVKNIQEMDVALGRWVDANVPAGERVAACDIGAIGFFGGRPVVDVFGLATPALAGTQSPSHMRTLAALKPLAPKYVILFPTVFPEWAGRVSLLKPIFEHRISDNSILASHVARAYEADWERFGRYYDDAILARIDPPDTGGALRDHWRRGLYNLGLRTHAELFADAGALRRDRGEAVTAESAFRYAIKLDGRHVPQAWVGLAQLFSGQQQGRELGAVLDQLNSTLGNFATGYEIKGDFMLREGQTAKAFSAWDAGLLLAPDSPHLLQRLEQLVTRYEGDEKALPYRAKLAELGVQPMPRPTE